MWILPKIMAVITMHPRFKQEWRWYPHSFFGNLFVVWKKIFWERCGKNGIGDTIKIFSSLSEDLETKESTYHYYSFEALVVGLEVRLYGWLKKPRLSKVRIVYLRSALPWNTGYAPMYSFAIAFDATDTENVINATTWTRAYTMSSTANGLLMTAINYSTTSGSNPIVTQTYAGSNMTTYQYKDDNATQGSMSVSYILGPASGSNNVSVDAGTVTMRRGYITSYTGVKQSGFPDAVGTGSPNLITVSQANLAVNTTSVADNCWGFYYIQTGTATTAGTNTTRRVTSNQVYTWLDTNAAQTPAGTFTMNATFSSSTIDAMYGSFAPFVASSSSVVTPLSIRSLLGVGI